MLNNAWSRLNNLQLGKYAEQFVKLSFLSYGYNVYLAEVDDHGIDFIIKSLSGKYYEIQVKSCQSTTGYVFAQKDKFNVEQNNLYMALVIFKNGCLPQIFLIPASAWKNENALLRNRNYEKEGQKSKPEWGVNISNKNMDLLKEYEISKAIGTLV